MTGGERRSLAAIPGILAIGAAIAWAGGASGVRVGDVPLFALCGAVAFGLNWLAFAPSFVLRTERWFDVTGSATYLTLVVLALVLGDASPRALLLAALVAIWAVRLGAFLFARIRRDGSDGRFDALKSSFPRFLMTWTLQGLWVFLTAGCALAAMSSAAPVPLGASALVGTLVFAGGFAIEVEADRQKQRFRADPANRGRFVESGLWAWSRHPNYFGEIALWSGIALVALPALSGWQHLTLVSPLFVYVLLTRVSGIPLLESRASRRWGDDPAYRAYTARTPVLWPRPPEYRTTRPRP